MSLSAGTIDVYDTLRDFVKQTRKIILELPGDLADLPSVIDIVGALENLSSSDVSTEIEGSTILGNIDSKIDTVDSVVDDIDTNVDIVLDAVRDHTNNQEHISEKVRRIEGKIDTIDSILDDIHDTDLAHANAELDSIETKIDELNDISIDNIRSGIISGWPNDTLAVASSVTAVKGVVDDIETAIGNLDIPTASENQADVSNLATQATLNTVAGNLSSVKTTVEAITGYATSGALDTVDSNVDSIKSTVEGITGYATGSALTTVGNNVNSIKTTVEGITGYATSSALATVDSNVDSIKSTVEGITGYATSSALGTVDSNVDSIKSTVEGITGYSTSSALSAVANNVNSIKSTVEGITGYATSSALSTVASSIGTIDTEIGIIDGLIDDIKSTVDAITGYATSTALSNVSSTVSNIQSTVNGITGYATASALSTVASDIVTIDGIVDQIKDTVEDIETYIEGSLTNTVNTISGYVDTLESVSNTIKNYVDTLESSMSSLLTDIGNIFDMFNGDNQTLLETFADLLIARFLESSVLTDIVNAVGEKIKDYFDQDSKISDFFEFFIDRIIPLLDNIDLPTYKWWNINRAWSTYKDKKILDNLTNLRDATNQGGFS